VKEMNIRVFMVAAALFLMAILSIPALAEPNIPYNYGHMYINTEVSGEAAVNETASLRWSTGTDGAMNTYEWKQSDNFVNPGDYTSHTRFTMEIGNESTSWDYLRWNTGNQPVIPGSWYMNDNTIMQPQYLISNPFWFSPPVPYRSSGSYLPYL
jgi:hypothetical protein